jgi:hypothetical protein
MKFKTLNGAFKTVKKPHKYVIDWEGKSRSKLQKKVKDFLFPFWENKVVFEEFPVVGTRLSVDIFNATDSIAIEVQGEQHVKYTPFFHGNNKYNYIDQLKRDHDKRKFLLINKITFIEVYFNDDLNKNLFKKQGVKLI